MAEVCPSCGDALDKNHHCPTCGMTLSTSGLRVSGTHYLQVLAVSAALIVLVFALAVAWKLLFR